MGFFKSKLDIAREQVAKELNSDLIGSNLHVSGGGQQGPYQLTITNLSRTTVEAIILEITTILARGN